MGSGSDATDAIPEPSDRSPFQGLGFYSEEDAKWFFGRTTERRIILAHLRTARLTLLYAESGVGKSSLLRAGVAARLRQLAIRGDGERRLPRFVPIVFSGWKDDPVAGLIAEIERQVGRFSPDRNGSASRAGTPNTGLAPVITDAARALNATLVIILDQFEEHFSYRLGATDPDRLAEELAACVNDDDVPANFLIAVREDAYGGLGDLFGGRISNIYNNYLHLDYLTRDAAREAIENPVEIYNAEHSETTPVTLEDELADAVLDEVRRGNLELGAWRRDRDGGGSLPDTSADEIETPFLQLVMTRLWECERAHGSTLLRRATLDRELGGAETIVRNHVGRALAGLDGQQLDAATDIFHELVTPSGVKVAHTADDLAKMTGNAADVVASVLGRLYEERILRAVDPAPGSTDARYEIFHDRLAAPILEWRSQQENARLERAKERAEEETKVQRAQARRFKRTARLMFGLAVGLLVLLVAVVALLAYARNQSETARRERHTALAKTAQANYFDLTTGAQSQLASRPDISLLLYLAADGASAQSAAERTLVATLHDIESSGAVGVLHGHEEAVNSVAFSPSGTTLASAGGDKTIRLWRVTQRAHYPLGAPLRASKPLLSLAFDPSGRTLASGSFDEVILWNVARDAQQAVIPYAGGALTSIAFSRTGVVAAAASDGTVLLWNAVNHDRTRLTISPGTPVKSVAFSPDGSRLAVASGGTVWLYDADTDREIGRPFQHGSRKGNVYSVAFSPDGTTLAAGGNGDTIDLWHLDTRSHRTLGTLGVVNSVAFSPNGRALAAGAGETTVWNLSSLHRGTVLRGAQGGVPSVSFSPDGRMLATGGVDGTIKLWAPPLDSHLGQPLATHRGGTTRVAVSPDGKTTASGGPNGAIYIMDRTGKLRLILRGHGAAITDLVFAPSGRVLAGSYDDGTIWLWNPVTGRVLGTLHGHDGAVYAIAFDSTGTRLAAGDRDGAVTLWDAQSHVEVGVPLKSDFGAVLAVAFSPNGVELASGGESRSISLWNVRRSRPIPQEIAEDATVSTLAFSPDGRLLASGGEDDTIRLWDVTSSTHRPVRALTGNLSFVRSIAFSPDGQTLASGGADNTVRLWDVGTGTELGTPLLGHTDSVESVAFAPDGHSLISGSHDGTVRLWRAVQLPGTFAELRTQICDFLGAGLGRTEWRRYAPSIPFHQACPQTTPS